jgi:hypothetical protein
MTSIDLETEQNPKINMMNLPGAKKYEIGNHTIYENGKLPFSEYIKGKLIPICIIDKLKIDIIQKKYYTVNDNNGVRPLTYNKETRFYEDNGNGDRNPAKISIINKSLYKIKLNQKIQEETNIYKSNFINRYLECINDTGIDFITRRIDNIKLEISKINEIFFDIQQNVVNNLNPKDEHIIFKVKSSKSKPLQTTFLDRYSDHDKIFDLIKIAKNIGLNISEVDEKKLMINSPCDRINDCNAHILNCLLIKIALVIYNYKNYLLLSIECLETHSVYYSNIYAFNDIEPDLIFELTENNIVSRNINLFEFRNPEGKILFEKVYCIRANNINGFISKLIKNKNVRETYEINCYLLCRSNNDKWNIFGAVYGDPIRITDEDLKFRMKYNEQMHENDNDIVVRDPKEVRRKNSIENKEERAAKKKEEQIIKQIRKNRKNEKPNTSDDDSIEGSFNMFDE